MGGTGPGSAADPWHSSTPPTPHPHAHTGPILALTQSSALLLLKAAIDPNNVLDWSLSTSTCSWQGITCNSAGNVTTMCAALG